MAMKTKLQEISGFYFTYHMARKATGMIPIKELEDTTKMLLRESNVKKLAKDSLEFAKAKKAELIVL